MKLANPIGWCDETTNAVTGCDKVSAGCKNCYAESGTRARVLRAQGIETWGPAGVRYPVAEFTKKVRKLNKLCICKECRMTYPVKRLTSDFKQCGGYPYGPNFQQCYGELRRIRLFADSNSDWLDEKWPVETLADFMGAINDAPNVDFLLLTKRPENWYARVMEAWDTARCAMDMITRWTRPLDPTPPPNIWFGVSVENQAMADKRVPELLKIPAAVRFLSVEPLLEQVNLEDYLFGAMPYKAGYLPTPYRLIDWVIIGGESGDGRRDCGVEAIHDAAAQCAIVGIPVYVKQDCAFKPGQQGRIADKIWVKKEFPQ